MPGFVRGEFFFLSCRGFCFLILSSPMQLDRWGSTWSCTERGWLHGGAWRCNLLPSLQPQLALLALLGGLVLFLSFLALSTTFSCFSGVLWYCYRRISTTLHFCMQFIRLWLKRPRHWTSQYSGFMGRWCHLWNWVKEAGDVLSWKQRDPPQTSPLKQGKLPSPPP